MDISFSGAGFMGCYYFGVVDCWNKYIPRNRVNRVAGASAGSLIAAYYLMDLPIDGCLKEIIELTEDVRKRPLGVFDRSNQIVDVLPQLLDRLFPEDAHKRVSGRLHVCMTRLKDMKKVIVNEFESRKDLIDALNCSCFIPVWSGNHCSTYQGVKHIDGGFSDNLPIFDEHTIRICCFAGQSDISPYDRAQKELLHGNVLNTPLYFTFANIRRGAKALFPPPASFIMGLLEQGFHDTKDFILTNDLIQCDSCYNKTSLQDQPIYSKISPTITPSVTPSITPAASYLNLNQLSDRKEDKKEAKINSELKKKKTTTKKGSSSGLLEPGGQSKAASSSSLKRGGPSQSSFSSQLKEKLRSCSPDSANSSSAEPSGNHNTPVIVVVTDENQDQQRQQGQQSPDELKATDSAIEISSISSSSGDSSGKSSPSPSENGPIKRPNGFIALRRNTIQQQDQLLVLQDRFKLAPNPLPSCPPSPSLNRHCTECIRMRQEARNDLINEAIRLEAEKYNKNEPPPKVNSLRSKLTSPIKWLLQLGTKSSYKFEENIRADMNNNNASPETVA